MILSSILLVLLCTSCSSLLEPSLERRNDLNALTRKMKHSYSRLRQAQNQVHYDRHASFLPCFSSIYSVYHVDKFTLNDVHHAFAKTISVARWVRASVRHVVDKPPAERSLIIEVETFKAAAMVTGFHSEWTFIQDMLKDKVYTLFNEWDPTNVNGGLHQKLPPQEEESWHIMHEATPGEHDELSPSTEDGGIIDLDLS